MADEKIIIQVEADTKSVDKSLDNLEKKSQSVGDGIEDGFKNAFKVQGLADLKAGFDLLTGSISYALNKAEQLGQAIINSALSGEKIESINKQFGLLASQAGLSSESIASGLIKAANGLADTEDILQAASKGLVTFGTNAEKLPQVFELARKAIAVFGGDLVGTFEQLSQAIASGQTKALKSLGIIVDSGKAYDDFAKSIGVATSSLTDAQKQQALLNAVLDQGSRSFEGVDINANRLGQSLTRLNVQSGELKDTINILVNETFGNFLSNAFTQSSDSVEKLNLQLKKSTDAGLTVDESIRLLNLTLKENEQSLSSASSVGRGFSLGLQEQNDKIREQISALNDQKKSQDDANESAFQRALKSSSSGDKSTSSGPTEEQLLEAANSRLKIQTDVDQQLLALKNQSIAQQIEASKFLQSEELRIEEEKKILSQQLASENEQARINENLLKIQDFENDLLTDAQVNALREAEEKRHQDTITQIKAVSGAKQNEIQKKTTLDLNRTLASGIVAGTQQIVTSLKNGENGFKAFGKAVLGIVGDMAIQLGTFYIINGIAVEALQAVSGTGSIAAGIALIALGSLLKSFSGGGKSEAASTSPGSSSAGAGFESAKVDTEKDVEEKKITAVQIDVQGTVLNPIQVGQQIAQILNDTFDATGTKVTTGAA